MTAIPDHLVMLVCPVLTCGYQTGLNSREAAEQILRTHLSQEVLVAASDKCQAYHSTLAHSDVVIADALVRAAQVVGFSRDPELVGG